jgi:hypothetical protein
MRLYAGKSEVPDLLTSVPAERLLRLRKSVANCSHYKLERLNSIHTTGIPYLVIEAFDLIWAIVVWMATAIPTWLTD